jgi:hypothetical protein
MLSEAIHLVVMTLTTPRPLQELFLFTVVELESWLARFALAVRRLMASGIRETAGGRPCFLTNPRKFYRTVYDDLPHLSPRIAATKKQRLISI